MKFAHLNFHVSLSISSLAYYPLTCTFSCLLQYILVNYCLQVQNAIEYLKIIGAFDESENLTVLGME